MSAFVKIAGNIFLPNVHYVCYIMLVQINKCSFEHFCVWSLFSALSHRVGALQISIIIIITNTTRISITVI